MVRYLSLLLLLLVPSLAPAQVVLDTAGASDGTYYFKVVVAGGKTTISPLETFSLKDMKPGPGPTPSPTPQPTPLVLEVERITKLALSQGGTVTTGAALSSAYSMVADQVAAGTLPPASAPPLLSLALNAIFDKVDDDAAWAAWRAAVSGALNELQAQGQLGTKELMSKTLKEIATGMNMATGFKTSPAEVLKITEADLARYGNRNLGILDGIDIAKLIELIKLVMELFKLFGGAVVPR